MAKLEKFLKILSRLRTDKNRSKWSPLTCHQAPHKPFLLLSILDLIAEGVIQKNFIALSLELVETFNAYWSSIMPPGTKGNMAYPFPRLKTDGFWHLVPNPGYENKIDDMEFSSMSRLREACAGAVIEEGLFSSMLDPESREVLRNTLINSYFAPEIRPRLVEQGVVNITAFEYSKKLLAGVREPHGQWEEASGREKNGRARDQGFRKAIVTLYDHRCALCGIRMITPEGHTVVEAAHIRPWRESRDDRPTNGLSLCRLCHWSFDEGLMSVGKDYEVLVSKRVRTDQNMPGHMLTLTDRRIFRPTEENFWPAQENLGWHRRKYFLK